MGLDLTLFMADWKQLSAIPVDNRVQALDDTTWPPGVDDEYLQRYGLAGGWLWPPDREAAWCAEYGFFTTTGAYRAHARAGDAWADIRPLVDASVREAMDTFLVGLIWDADPADDPALTGGGGFFPPATDRGFPHVLLVCPPEAVSGKALAWKQVESHLEELREPFAAECEGWAGRPDTFEDFTALLCEWGDVTTEAARRSWGLVGLP
ncbi:hypothetical protein OG978_03830 [Streptomyces sp. NBC_01591]|uniref:hypothetical protein n=1 Tax=Streptomyces sp. NBC_01591 TaxID=2975888 RepID=UPI002DDB7585|nr:hypothetical protein [Streptomyces sp. NBC_01591]WSD66584.1 hypothetical protein OG978_03830 [Streptomyces sp. NBC_01591]